MTDLANTVDLSQAGVLIAAHGSPSTSGGRTSTRRHADTIRKLGVFARVEAAFLTEKPFVKTVFDQFDSAEIYVVPNLTCAGYVTTTKLPQALGLTGAVTQRITPDGRQTVYQTAPVGTDPGIAPLFAGRILAALKDLRLPTADTAVVVVGHGSRRSRASYEHTNAIAQQLAQHGVECPVSTTFLEEPPFVRNWQPLTSAKNVVFAPFLISDGYHGSLEIPRDIGFDATAADFIKRLGTLRPNVCTRNGQRLVYLPPLGDVPQMSRLILHTCIQTKIKFQDP